MGVENNFIPFTGDECPVHPTDVVQLQLENGNAPINFAGVFHWGINGRGILYPVIKAWRHASDEEFVEYQRNELTRKSQRALDKLNKWNKARKT